MGTAKLADTRIEGDVRTLQELLEANGACLVLKYWNESRM
jgi:hypothetical protein